MKALFISNDPTLFSEESAVRARLRAYAVLLGELHVISAGPRGAKEVQDGVLCVYPVSHGVLRLLRMYTKARAIIRDRQIDVVSAQDPFEHGFVALRACAGTEAKLHIQIHTDFLSPYFARESLKNKVRVLLADKIIPRAAGIRVVSERIRRSLMLRYDGRLSRVAVIPIATSETVPEPVPLPPHSFSFTLLAISRLEKEKRLEDLFQALTLVRKKYPHTGLYLAGAGRESASLARRVTAMDLSANVFFLGERPDVRALFGSVQAFVQASAYEGYGRTFIEAALAKVPIVTTDVGIVGEVLLRDTDVLASPVGDPAALAENIIRLIEDNQLRRVVTLSAHAAVEKHLATLRNQPEKLVEDLRACLGSGRTVV